MNAGKLSRRIELQYPVVTRTSGGHVQTAYTTDVTTWAEMRHLKGREYYEAQQIKSEVSVEFIIRHHSNVTTTWRVKYGARNFDIENVVPERNGMMRLACKEVK